MTTIHVGDIGTILRVEVVDSGSVAIPVTEASAMQILLQDPNGIKKQLVASFFSDGADGLIEAATLSGTIDVSGVWQMQGHVTFPSGSFHTAVTNFTVASSLLP